MILSKRELPILLVNIAYITTFGAIALRRTNYEFMLYIGVVIILGVWIVCKQRSVRFDRTILWGLTVWGLLHMAGGNLRVGDGVLYGLQLIPIFPSLNILRYDQVIHMFGFGVATLACHHLLRPYLTPTFSNWRTLAILIVLMGSGLGAINEILEFTAVLIIPETGVGGYSNTMLDLVFNLIGGILAVIWLTWQRKRVSPNADV